MQNFSLRYTANYDHFFPDCAIDPLWYDFEDGIYEGEKITASTNYEDCLLYVKELRSIIKRDLQNIIELRIRKLNNNEGLIRELETVIETIDNGVEYDAYSENNFFFLTDRYLCFNNYENFVDELTWGELGDDAKTYATIVIIDVNLKNFYFVRITTKMAVPVQCTTINAYTLLKDGNIKKRKINFKTGVSLDEYTDEGIKKILSMLV